MRVRFMMIVKADKRTEAGVLPTHEDISGMDKYNQALIKAGILVDAAGLRDSSQGARVTWQNGKLVVTDGPFAELKEIIAGYWVINVKSKAEAIEWARRIPFEYIPGDGRVPEVEIRQFFEDSDFQ
jgi:hypothetical protein